MNPAGTFGCFRKYFRLSMFGSRTMLWCLSMLVNPFAFCCLLIPDDLRTLCLSATLTDWTTSPCLSLVTSLLIASIISERLRYLTLLSILKIWNEITEQPELSKLNIAQTLNIPSVNNGSTREKNVPLLCWLNDGISDLKSYSNMELINSHCRKLCCRLRGSSLVKLTY